MSPGPRADAPPRYDAYKRAFAGRRMPFAFVDLDRLDANAEAIARRAGDKRIRIASKSVRSVAILRRLLASDDRYQGIMCYHPQEAVYLSQAGFDDLLLGYPAWHEDDLGAICAEIRRGTRIVAMVDSVDHVARASAIARTMGVVLPLCLDVDMSTSLPGLHFGVRRSGVSTSSEALAVAEAAREAPHVELVGLMGYEAQIAGVPDASPGDMIKNLALGGLKALSIKEVAARRARIVQALSLAGVGLELVNGGGTGSLESTIQEPCVTEVTVGSGFYSPALFDGYQAFKHQPAAGYAIEITRKPAPGLYTCAGGGYVGSGACDKTKLPSPYLPPGARLLELEGAGEVQTPVAYTGPEPLGLGDPIFMRHAKAGELMERFETILLLEGGEVTGEVTTYRGDGLCFL